MCIYAGSNRRFRVSPRSAARLTSLTFLMTLLVSASAPAQNRPAESPEIRESSPAQKDQSVADAKKSGKYDVSRIGQRDIGRGVNIYSRKRERALGERIASVLDRSTKLLNDEVVNQYITRVADKLGRNSDADIPFTVRIVDSGDVPRAYGLPGGFLYVSRALILSADGEAELAGVMAHEIAHVAARHATRALTRRQLFRMAGAVAMFAGPAGILFEDTGGLTGPLSVNKFDRNAEYEADLLGVEYAYAAGYDPEAVVAALERLHALELERNAALSKIPGYHVAMRIPWHSKMARGFANYPATEERIRRLQQEIPAFLPDRKDYVVDTEEFEEVKARLLEASKPVLRHHTGDEDNKGPVLRRVEQYQDTQHETDTRALRTFR